ncbi:MAG: anti-sigma-E factor RseA [Plesiomonas sp.]|uniref:anti-sigma-E factor RseA n=1 Tax=Plesiomonas sp. TaxID=2486279 RepID=UPI003F2FC7E8
MQKEQLSALMDGESVDSVLLSELSKDRELQGAWRNYHLIRDTLRGETPAVLDFDITFRLAAALENEPTLFAPNAVPESQPTPETWHKLSFWEKIRPVLGNVSQLGLAACVSLGVIVGVQYYNQPESGFEDSPVFNTLPIGGQASPVSYSVPTSGAPSEQQLQEQRKRISAMLQDYELQRRLNAENIEPRQNELSQQAGNTQH